MSVYCSPGSFPYTIQPGDTYWDLADRFNVSVDDIIAINPDVDPDFLLVGQVICMPIDPPPRGGERGRRGYGRRREFEHRPYYPYYNPYYNPYYPYPY